MSPVTEQLNTEIYPRLFQVLESALPEFGFKRIPKGYMSTTENKVTGEIGKNGKVYVYEDNISYLKDWSRKPITIWNYVQERDGLSQGETFKKLAELADYALTTDSMSEDAIRNIAEANRKAQLWEDANSFFKHCLNHSENEFAIKPGGGAEFTRNYLLNDRGYKPNLFLGPDEKLDRNNPKMEVGYVPSLYDLQNHLVNEIGYSAAEASSLITDARIGDTHRLSIPYRDPSGRIRGMVFRSTTGAEKKYLYSTGLEKRSILFNLKGVIGDKDLVLVEGVLDALHATAAGLPNVVAIGGNGMSLTREHIELAIKYGARKVTLLLDNDKVGISGALSALSLLQKFPRLKTYVAFVDPQYKDLDKLLTLENGIERAKWVIANAVDGWRYQLDQLFAKYETIQNDRNDGLTDKEIRQLQEEIIETAGGLSRLDSGMFIEHFLSVETIKNLGVTQATLDELAEEVRQLREKEARKKSTKDLLTKASSILEKGGADETVDLLLDKAQEIKDENKGDLFDILTQPANEKEMAARIRRKSTDLRTGYKIQGEDLEIPAGALTILAAPTSHGKTTLMLNLGLRIIEHHPKKSIYVFSYEEDADSVMISAMNAYMKVELNGNNRKFIRSYYRKEADTYARAHSVATLEAGKAKFFKELIDTQLLNIHYVDYDTEKLVAAIRHLHKYGNAGAILIDYMQLLHIGQNGKNKYGSRQEEIKQICLDLKDVAVETGLPLILGAQFTRQVVNPARLHYTYIREAADIEQIANLILGFWNNNFDPFAAKDELNDLKNYHSAPGHLYVKKLKHRNGVPELTEMWAYDANLGIISNDGVRSY